MGAGKPLRVCYVSTNARETDGWGRYTAEVVRSVRTLGIEPVLALADPDVGQSLSDVERHLVVPPLFKGRHGTLRSLLYAGRLRRVLRTCDLVHGVVEGYLPLVALGRRPGQPTVQTAHGTWAVRPFESGARRVVFERALRHVDLLIIQSRYTRDAMARLVNLPAHEVLGGGVRPGDFEHAPAGALPEWTRDGRIVLGVGAVKPRKGCDVAVEAVARVRAQFPDLRLVLVGPIDEEGEYARALHLRAADRGMADRFHTLGMRPFPELVAWYRRADVFMLLPVNQGNTFEGLGLVYLEAAAAGVPSIGTTECGAADAIVDGATGLLVPQRDAAAAADALARLLGNGSLRDTMGAAARARARELSWDRLAAALADRYAALAGRSRS
jgi:phosphatidylinositol alpha-1,6-mannosyltransferase